MQENLVTSKIVKKLQKQSGANTKNRNILCI